jgi:hypothetical protein
MTTITTYNRIATVSAPQTKEQKTTHKIAIPFLGTWEVSDKVIERMRKSPSADIMGKSFNKETLNQHLAGLEK